MTLKPTKHRRARSQKDQSNVPRGADATITLYVSPGGYLVANAAVPLVLAGVPRILLDGEAPSGASQISKTSVRLDYASQPQTGNTYSYVIPARDPACRTVSGGYLQAGSGSVS